MFLKKNISSLSCVYICHDQWQLAGSVRFINISDIMHCVQHYYITFYRNYTMPLMYGVIWNWGGDIFAFIIIYHPFKVVFTCFFMFRSVFLWMVKMIENTLTMERVKFCLHYGTQLWIWVWRKITPPLPQNTPGICREPI